MKLIFMAFFSSFFLAATAGAQTAKPEVFMLCKLGSQVRTIAVHKKGDGYVTIYSKFGKPQEVGSGHLLDSNKRIMENIKTNLEKSSFNCHEVSEASVQSDGGE
jgi:hypothetical protein